LQIWESRIETLEDELAAEAELAQCGSTNMEVTQPERAALVEEQLQALKKEIG
jgi:hypothetical protein